MFPFRYEEMQPYNKTLRCFPVVMMAGKERTDVDRGGKIILPGSALEHLTRLHIQFPMLFKLLNKSKNRETHCGVLEFVAEEGRCYLPYWMMKNLWLSEGEIIQVQYVNLDIARFAKFQPQSVDFLEITNPKAVLENALRNFATLTKGDVVSINYNEKDYELCILETRPGDAVSIIECDMDVDFAPPVGYEEPVKKEHKPSSNHTSNHPFSKEKAVVNIGHRLDGKSIKQDALAYAGPSHSKLGSSNEEEIKRGHPFYDYPIGLIRLNRKIEREEDLPKKQEPPKNTGQKLKNIGKA